jgi:hypothetical protein
MNKGCILFCFNRINVYYISDICSCTEGFFSSTSYNYNFILSSAPTMSIAVDNSDIASLTSKDVIRSDDKKLKNFHKFDGKHYS